MLDLNLSLPARLGVLLAFFMIGFFLLIISVVNLSTLQIQLSNLKMTLSQEQTRQKAYQTELESQITEEIRKNQGNQAMRRINGSDVVLVKDLQVEEAKSSAPAKVEQKDREAESILNR